MGRASLANGGGGSGFSDGSGPSTGGNSGLSPRETGNTQSNRPNTGTRTAVITGGVGGGGGGTPSRPTQQPSRPQQPTPAPARPLAPVPIKQPGKLPEKLGKIPLETVYELPPINVPIVPNKVNPPAKDPQPVLPSARGIKGNVPITINPNRYKISSGPNWSISAAGERGASKITPIRFQRGTRPQLIPLLVADGFVVKVRDRYLVSIKTLADIENSGNPHYDIVQNGTVLQTAMGKSIPIIELNVDTLVGLGEKRDLDNAKAGIRQVEYIYESPTVYGIPEGIIRHINYILDPNSTRPPDNYELWNLNLRGDYGLQRFTTYTLGKTTLPNSSIEVTYRIKENDKRVLDNVTARMRGLRADLNLIKGCFFTGKLSTEDVRNFTPYGSVASTDPATGEVVSTSYITKTIVEYEEVVDTLPKPSILPRIETRTGGGRSMEGTINPKTGAPVKAVVKTNPESDDLNRWKSYGFTREDVAEILRDARVGQAPFVEVESGEVMGIGAVRFGPALCRKARIVLPLGSTDTRAFEDFYGAGMTSEQYGNANRRRIAELLNLAVRINETELRRGKTLSK